MKENVTSLAVKQFFHHFFFLFSCRAAILAKELGDLWMVLQSLIYIYVMTKTEYNSYEPLEFPSS